MKKLSIILVAVIAAVTLFSCKDDSGVYAEQFYTDIQKENAIRTCLDTCADVAVSHLCDTNGFYSYNDAAYRIDYYPLASMFDTLEAHGHGNLIDSLILSTNRLAESCGSQVSSALHNAIDSLEIIDYDRLIDGENDAITRYFELYEYRNLQTDLISPVSIRMPIYHVSDIWNEMVQKYLLYSTTPLNFDIQGFIIDEMLDAIFLEMRVEEELIRTDPDHGSESMAPLKD